MTRLKLFWKLEKEEEWLQEMAAQGWQLKSVSFGYTFYKAPPEAANIKMDCRSFKREQDYLDYVALFEDSGWRHIAGKKGSGNQYFKRMTGGAEEDIFSDAASRAGRYKRLSDMWLTLLAICFPFMVLQCVQHGAKFANFFENLWNLKSFYLTPGLWQMNGLPFWQHFLFETPFALGRALPPVFIFLLVLFFLVGYFVARGSYKKMLR